MVIYNYGVDTGKSQVKALAANELCVINAGIHHRISQVSENNRLCVISIPRWRAEDEIVVETL